ncbi:hypothetical protein PLICRDRAFT_45260 [Plicaturopsis crispa FD-325 SS-3]|uniref:PH domain-containing protein n=1 Tax=Plicaturopsis crispa FD-325 SS-3 TaxID=944288 RepID=A0A0C9T739_PLICR|nr:hypothetical protein PLICRDRAFT_45260 [Plicaturopsis crispa FD-325 SS-3]
MAPSAAPPSPQEIHRKLSLHSTPKPPKPINTGPSSTSGNESDSDSVLGPDAPSLSTSQPHGSAHSGGMLAGSSSQPPLSSIAERRTGSGDESEEEDEEDEEEGGWMSSDRAGKRQGSVDESVIKAGYLWKKGERRKTWKKRWFVLRPAHIAYYKTAAEYQLLRLLELSDVHSCTPCSLKNHDNTFGLVSAARTFYLQAKTQGEVQEWVKAIQETRDTLMAAATQKSSVGTSPIPIPVSRSRSGSRVYPQLPITPSPPSYPHHTQNATSSDSEDGSPNPQRVLSSSPQNRPIPSSPSKAQNATGVDLSKVVLSGYLMKCGSKRRNWRKRWFVLNGERLIYSASHMDTKPHRQFAFSEILDAIEYDLPPHRANPALISPPVSSPPHQLSSPPDEAEGAGAHTFKIITTKRTLLLCAPSEEEEIKWLSAVRALIARRSGAGAESGGGKNAGPVAAEPSSGVAPSASGSGGLKNKVRRLSISGSSGAAPDAGASERPS